MVTCFHQKNGSFPTLIQALVKVMDPFFEQHDCNTRFAAARRKTDD